MINRLFYKSDPSDKYSLLLKINIIALLAVAIFLRITALDHIPGLSGDEAWYGIQMQQLYHNHTCSLLTPNKNPLNPFFSGLIFILHLFSPPHILVLRVPAVLSGLLFVLLTYILVRKMTDSVTATIAVILIAAFPTNIAYSRLGWDSSQIGLVSCLVIYFAWQENWLALSASVLAAFLIHPTTVFLLPIIAVPIIADLVTRRVSLTKLPIRGPILWVLGAAVLIFCIFYLLPLANQILSGPAVLQRMVSPSKWLDFFVLFGRFISGLTVSKYMAGYNCQQVIWVHDLLFGLLFPLLIVLGGRRLVINRRWKEFALVCGFLLSAIVLFISVGNRVILPGQERFSVYLMAPCGWALAFTLRIWGRTPGRQQAVILMTGLIGWLLMISFYHTYFQTIRKTGGLAGEPFRTAQVEPKRQVANIIAANTTDDSNLFVLSENFWLYQTIRYLLSDHQNLKAVDLMGVGYPLSKFVEDMHNGAFAVGFAKGEIVRVLQYIPWSESYRRWTIRDYGGRDLIYVWHCDPKANPNIP